MNPSCARLFLIYQRELSDIKIIKAFVSFIDEIDFLSL